MVRLEVDGYAYSGPFYMNSPPAMSNSSTYTSAYRMGEVVLGYSVAHGGLGGGSVGALIDSVSGLGTSLGSLGAPGVGSLGALGALGAGALSGAGGILSLIMGALGLTTAVPAGILTSAPNSLIGLSQLFGG